MTTDSDIEAVWRGGAILGECPVWDAGRSLLWWIDCAAPALHAFDPSRGANRTVPLADRIHAIGLCGDGGLVAAVARGLARLDPQTGATALLASPETRADHRFNDGKCSPDGAFWVGSMHRGYAAPSGRLYRLDPSGAVAVMLDGLTVPNGPGWSPDGTSFYLGDSPTGTIRAFTSEGGALGAWQVLAGPDLAPGWPDGLAVDAEGGLWNARWDGGCVVRITPDGRLDRTLRLPASRPTSCAFGGAGLDRLYVTSASIGLDEAARAAQPLAGALFCIHVSVPGAPVGRFAG